MFACKVRNGNFLIIIFNYFVSGGFVKIQKQEVKNGEFSIFYRRIKNFVKEKLSTFNFGVKKNQIF